MQSSCERAAARARSRGHRDAHYSSIPGDGGVNRARAGSGSRGCRGNTSPAAAHHLCHDRTLSSGPCPWMRPAPARRPLCSAPLRLPWLPVRSDQAGRRRCCLQDDLGWSNVGWHDLDQSLITSGPGQPHMKKLVAEESITLDRHYAYPYCSPTRASTLTGRLPYHVNQINIGSFLPGAGVARNMTMIPV